MDEREAETILLAKEIHAEDILIDETLGRNVARREEVPFIGLMGVFLMATERGFIPAMAPLLGEVEHKEPVDLSEKKKLKPRMDTDAHGLCMAIQEQKGERGK